MDIETLIKLAQAAPGVAIAIAVIWRGPAIIQSITKLVEVINADAEKRHEQFVQMLGQISALLAASEKHMTNQTAQVNEMLARLTGSDYRLETLGDEVKVLRGMVDGHEDLIAKWIKDQRP